MGNLSIQEQQELASKLLKVDLAIIKQSSEVVEHNYLLVTLTEKKEVMQGNYRGGVRLLIDNSGEVLFCSSSAMSNDKLLNEFKLGRRTPLERFN